MTDTRGEPYSRVKQRARYMLAGMTGDEAAQVVVALINTRPGETLDALCDVWSTRGERRAADPVLARVRANELTDKIMGGQ